MRLDWETASETYNNYFVVQRSLDGTAIESIDTIDGNGTTSELSRYTSADETPYSGLSYYRFQQVDFNGSSSCTEWKPVLTEAVYVMQVYPNPSTVKFSLSLPGDPG